MPSMRLRPLPAVFGVAVALALAACASGGGSPSSSPSSTESESASPTPTPTPEPTRPATADLVLTPDGLGTLVIGVAPSAEPELQMIEFVPDYCAFEGGPYLAGDPAAARWIPIAEYLGSGGDLHWSVDAYDGPLARIDVHDSTVPTDRGIRIGDSRAAALAAYPDAVIVPQWGTDLLVLPGSQGVLHLEIAKDPSDIPGYWAGQLDQVVYLRAVELSSGTFSVAASENIAGGCL
jgi:hypothetical protein